MLVYGRNPVREAIRGPRRVERIWASEAAVRGGWLAGAPLTEATEADLTERCGSRDHQGVVAEVADFEYADPDRLLADDDALVIALDEVQDPHNLGAVCRVAESAGCAGVVICERRAAQVTPAVCAASAGAVEHLAIARVRNLADWLATAKDGGAWIYGASADADVAYAEPDYGGRVVVVLGAEGRGLRDRVAATCDQLIALPRRGQIASLNVATAAAALVYGILHFRSPT